MSENGKPGAHTWRDLPSRSGGRGTTAYARKRRFLRIFRRLFWAAFFAGLIGAALCGAWYVKTHPEILRAGEPFGPVARLELITNGVLTREWCADAVGFRALEGGNPDVAAMKRALEAHGQVRRARVERIWPDLLRVKIEEEQPVARVNTAAKQPGRFEIYCVSRRGVVYPGFGYADSTLKEMPFLDGIVLRKTAEGYAPIRGMPVVADLLEEAALRLPRLRADWRVVSLEDFDGRTDVPWSVIRVRTRNMGEIVFAPRDFPKQLDRLATIANDLAGRNRKAVKIDLALGDESAVQLAEEKTPPRRR